MSRTFRVRSFSGLYHVILRGIDRRAIFLDEMDRVIFLKSLAKAKEKSGFKLYAYCLMDKSHGDRFPDSNPDPIR